MSGFIFVVFIVIAIAIVGHFAFKFYEDKSYAMTLWERILATSRDSHTILVTKVIGLLSSVLGALSFVADAYNAAGLSTVLSNFLKPEVIAVVGCVMALVTYIARMRPGSKDPL